MRSGILMNKHGGIYIQDYGCVSVAAHGCERTDVRPGEASLLRNQTE